MAIEITSFKPYTKNTLRGFLTLRLTNIGLEVRDATLHEKNGKRWIQLPSKAYQKDEKTLWTAIVDFYDKARSEQFQKAALEAIDQFMKKGGADGF